MTNPVWLTLLLCLSIANSAFSADTSTVIVSAGEFDRIDTPVFFQIPDSLGAGPFQLKDSTGKVSPVQMQMDGARRGCFVLNQLKLGESAQFTLEKASAPADGAAGVAVSAKDLTLEISVEGQKVLAYHAGKTDLPPGFEPQYQRGGYLFPVFSPSGKLVIDDYPPNHKHHHGIWSSWTKTEFEGRHPDFWNMGAKTGTVEPTGKPEFSSGPVFASIKATNQFIDLTATPAKTVLNEVWELTVFSVGNSNSKYRIFDLVTRQACTSDRPLKLPKYYYGGMGVRGNRNWNGKENLTFTTSEGKTRTDGNETRGRWAFIGGKVDDRDTGIAILCHPDNFRAPQPMRIHPNEPFFCFAPSQLGDWEIVPGTPYVARYRFVVQDGTPDSVQLDRLWHDYATPPQVTVK